MGIVLGSQSPRRQELLARLGLEFEVKVADIDETMDDWISPKIEVRRVSRLKAAEISKKCSVDDLIITADTIVVLDDKILGKPSDRDEAVAMLTALSDQTHSVITAVTLLTEGHFETFLETTSVTFRPILPSEIQFYVDSGEPMDKAGGYGIQGIAGAFVRGICGDYYNVMGLPLCALTEHLRQLGVEIF